MKLKSIFFSLIAIALLASCSTSNNVVGGGIQKRKYNDGFYVSGSRKFDRKTDTQKIETVLIQEETSEKKESKIVIEEFASKQEEITTIETPMVPAIQDVQNFEKFESGTGEMSLPQEIINGESTPVDLKNKRIYKHKTIMTVVTEAAAAESGLMLVLLVILCFILPPLAVFLVQDASTMFWIDLILWLLGWGVGYWLLGGLGGLCTLVAVIVALLVVFGVI